MGVCVSWEGICINTETDSFQCSKRKLISSVNKKHIQSVWAGSVKENSSGSKDKHVCVTGDWVGVIS